MAKPSREEANQRLLNAIDSFSTLAYGSETDEELSSQRALSIERYLGRNIDPAPLGRSQVRDRTTFEVVEWIKPSLLRIFTSGSEVCRFDPVGPEDIDQADQETDYVNHVLTQRNNWHQLCLDWFSDALLLKSGYAHPYWDESKSVESEFYENLTDDAFSLVAADPEVQIAAHSQRPNEEADKRNTSAYQQQMQQYQQQMQQMQMQMAQQPPPQPGQPPPQQPQPPPPPQKPAPAFFHDIELKRVNKRGQVKLCVIAPERTLVDVNTPDHTLTGCNYFEYWDGKTIGALRASGLKVPDDIGDSTDDMDRDSSVELARDLYNERSLGEDTFADKSMRTVKVRYIWIRHDYDGDGINELQYCIVVGSKILYRQECEEIPIASITPIPLAHRHVGMSIADSVADIEDINTNITRQAIDNLNLSNTPRIAVSDRVNMADLLDVRVGGVIRVDGQPPQEFMPVEVPSVFGNAVQALQFFDSRRQNRTGINAYFQGTDADAINKTASGISQLTNSAAQRVEMIARIFATGVERLFLIVHRLILQHGHSEEVIRLRNKWVTVDPAQWRKRNDVKIAVGLGTGNKDSQLAQLNQMFQLQMAVAPMGVARPENLYATMIELAKAASFPTPERFVTDPAQNPPPPPQPPPEVQVEQMRGQTAMQTKQIESQSDAQKFQAQTQLDQQKMQSDMAFKKWQEEQQLAFDKWKVEFEAAAERELEMMKLGHSSELEHTKMAREDSRAAVDQQQSDLVKNVDDQMKALQSAYQELADSLDKRKVQSVEKIRDPRTGRMVAGRIKRADGSIEEVPIH